MRGHRRRGAAGAGFRAVGSRREQKALARRREEFLAGRETPRPSAPTTSTWTRAGWSGSTRLNGALLRRQLLALVGELGGEDSSLIASICTTSSATFIAPSTATVATGMPFGICTVA